MQLPLQTLRLAKQSFAVAIIASTVIPFKAHSLPTSNGAACSSAVLNAGDRLKRKHSATLISVVFEETQDGLSPIKSGKTLSFTLANYPTSTTSSYEINVRSKNESIMNSPRLQVAVASLIMAGCQQVDKVEFGMNHTGWIEPVYRMHDGTVKSGVSVPCRARGPELPWGYYMSC